MNDTSLLPPPYSRQSARENKLDEDAPPVYTFPSSFAIGAERTSGPLVDTAQLKSHLSLLHAFAELRRRVDGFEDNVKEAIPLMPDDLERRWAWFVGLAVERFSVWCFNTNYFDVAGRPIEDFLPPLDVLMVWHAYMLNPGWYSEDHNRLQPLALLKMVEPTFVEALPRLSEILVLEPSTNRVKSWNMRTQRAFDPLEDAMRQHTRIVYCPTCRYPLPAPLMTDKGQGYLQQNFATRCPQPSCINQPVITKAVLAARKLAEDLVRDDGTSRRYLAGTLHSPLLDYNVDFASQVKTKFLDASRFSRPKRSTEEGWIVSILRQTKYSIHEMKKIMSRKFAGRVVPRIMSAYVDDRIFSVELVGAVLRQGSFVKKMHDLLWTLPEFFKSHEDELALQHAIARYHAFLDLMSSSPVSFFVPTLDIDLAWHTHQLMPQQYNADCKKYVGRFVNHDDKIEEDRLSTSFDITCRAWKNRFGVRYTHCGCPLPGDTIGQRLSRLVGAYTRNPSYLVPPDRIDLLAATHPSDHNAVFVMHQRRVGEWLQTSRRKKFEKRRKRDEELVKNGKLDPKVAERTIGHEQAFLIPVPMYFMYGPVVVGCAAGTGHFVNNSTTGGGSGCAAGAGACGFGTGDGGCGGNGGCGGGGGGGGGGSGGGGGCGGCGGKSY